MALGLNVFIGGDIRGLQSAILKAKDIVDDFGTVSDGVFSRMEKGAQAAAAAVGGLAVGFSMGALVKSFADFQSQLNEIEAVSGATREEMAKLNAQALALGASTKFSASEAAAGMGELAKAGFTVDQVMSAIPGTMALAAAGGVSIAQASELAAGAINGFRLQADQAGRVADVMAQAANRSAVGIGDLQLTMKYVAPVAAAANQSLEEMSGAIAIMGNSMIRGEQAGTTLRAAMVRLQDPPKEVAEVLHQLGVAVSDAQGRMLPLGAIVDQLRQKTASMTEVQRNAAIASIFGTEALSGMLTLVKATPAEYQAMVDSMRDAEGAAQRMADTMNQGVGPALEQLSGAADTLKIQFGEQLGPSAHRLANIFQGLVESVSKLPPEIKGLIVAMAGGAAIFGVVAAPLALIGATSRLAHLGLTALGAMFPGLASAAGGVAVGLGRVAAQSGALGVAARLVLPALFSYAGLFVTLTAAVAGFMYASQDTARQQRQVFDSLNDTATEVKKLGAEYEALKAKTRPTIDEQQRMRDILDRLQAIAPEVVSSYNSMGRANDVDRDAMLRWIGVADQKLAKMRELGMEQGRTEREAARAEVAQARIALQDLKKEERELQRKLKAVEGTAGYDPRSGYQPADPQALSLAQQRLNEKRAQIRDAAKALDDVDRTYASKYMQDKQQGPKVPSGYVPAFGDPVADPTVPKPSRSTGGKSEQEQAAEKALDGLLAKYSRLIQISDAYGGGLAGQKALWQQFLAEVQNLAPFERVRTAIADTRTQLAALNGALHQQNLERIRQEGDQAMQLASEEAERRGAALREARKAEEEQAALIKTRAAEERKAAAERLGTYDRMREEAAIAFDGERESALEAFNSEIALIKKREEAASLAAGQDVTLWGEREAARARYEGSVAGITEREKQHPAVIRAVWVESLRDIGGELAALALDPSWERIANLAKSMLGDPAQVKRWSEDLSEATAAMTKAIAAGRGLDETASTLLGTFDPLTLGIGAATKVLTDLVGAFKAASDAAKSLAEDTADTYANIARMKTAQIQDPVERANAERENRITEANKKLADKIRERQELLKKSDPTRSDAMSQALGAINSFVPGAGLVGLGLQARNALMPFVDDPEIKALMTEYQLQLDEIGRDTEETIAKADKATADASAKVWDAAVEALASYQAKLNEAQANQAKAEDELNLGGRDDWGNRISLEAEKQLRIQQAQADAEVRIGDLKARRLDIQKQLTKLNEDEAASIRAIENRGIAERAGSEALTKAQEIEKLKAENQLKRDAFNQELADIATKIKAEEVARDKAISNIQILADEKILALRNEADAMQGVIDKTAALLAQEQARLSTLMAIAALGGTVVQQSSLPQYHDGGVVPGEGEQTAEVLGGEMWLTRGQQANLFSWISRPQTRPTASPAQVAAGTSVQVGDINLNLYQQPGESGEALGRRAWDQINDRLPRMGHRFRPA